MRESASMKNTAQYFKDPQSLILAFLVSVSLLGAWLYTKEAPGLDYYVAWVAADAVKNDTPHNIYESSSRYTLAVLYRNKADGLENAPRQKQMAAHRRVLPMTATPFLYWVTAVLATGDYEKDLSRWHLLSLILLTGAILVMCRLLGYSPATSFALLLPIVVWFTPFYSDLRVANVNSFQLGLIALILWLQSRQSNKRYLFTTGLITGLLVMFKPNLAPVALLLAGGWAVRRQYLKLGISLSGMATGAFTAVLVSSIWLGNAMAWLDWWSFIQQVVDGGPGEIGGNYAMITQFSRGISPLGQLTTAVILSLLCLAFFWWGRRGATIAGSDTADKERELIEDSCLIAMACIVSMLASTLVWLHYYLLIIPMLIVAFRPWQEPGRMKTVPFLMLRVLPVIALVILLETALRAIIGSYESTGWVIEPMTSTAILFVVGLWQFGYGIRVQPDPQADVEPAAH